ncbi:uncharacterized protein LOC143289741 [Babylonia areolata]|uniref:uncharacterized protein LOC143289741 n=1 Tax=Babylonia areolata TaxID=304850 RepID=UPI003FD5C637
MAVKIVLMHAFLAGLIMTCKATPTTNPPPPGCPHGCKCTDDGLTVDCSNRGLVRVPPMSARVTKLDLSGNLLGPMINGSLEHLRQLQEVDLSHNGFLRLQLCTFTGLLHLRKVDLHGNRLQSLPSGLFADNGGMEVLDLSHNHLDQLPDLLLHGVPQLKVLNVSHNHATLLKLGIRFQRLTQLTLLDLSHNAFTNVTQDAFETASMWDHGVSRAIDLSYCHLQELHPQALTSVPTLKNLSLTGNPQLPFQQVVDVLMALETSGLEVVQLANMSISSPELFSGVTLMALRGLDLSSNAITAVPANTFGNVRTLQRLDLSGNLLTGLGEGFGDLVNLVELNMSHCRLTSFKGSPVGSMEHLTSLDLSHNHLLEPGEVELAALRHLRHLDLGYNSLQGVVLPGDCSHLVSLLFTSNALTTLPSMAHMRSLKYFSASDNNLQSLGAFLFTEASDILVANFSNNDLTSVDHRAFLPASPRIIDLSNNFLTRTQFFSWTSTQEVYLHNNKLNEMDQQTFYGMDRLRVLDLRHNNLSVIGDETFKFLSNVTTLRLSNNSLRMSNFFQLLRTMGSLEDLDLGYNQIKTINGTSFQPLVSLTSLTLTGNKLRVIPVQLLLSLEKLTQLDISGNPFDCDCELLPLQEWLKKTSVKVKQRFDLNITNRCLTPPEHRGKLITLYTVGQFQCNTKMLYMVIFGSIGGFGIVVGIIASLVCHYCGKCRKKPSGGDDRPGQPVLKDDNSSRKETNRNRVDLVRVSKRPDPYSKEDLVNGWVASKQFSVAKQNVEPHHQKKLQQVPPRPPWPEQAPARNKKDQKGGKEKGKEKGEAGKSKRENPDKRIHSLSEMVAARPPKDRYPRNQSLVPVWDGVYYDKHRVNLKPRPDRWADVDTYPTWHQAPGVRPVYLRDSGRYYTLPYPAPWPRFSPYGPEYPYRVRTTEEEEDRYRPRQTRALPFPPRQQDLRVHNPRPPADYRNNQRYPYDPYAAERARDYENLRGESWRLAQEERAYREDLMDIQRERQAYDTDRQAYDTDRHTDRQAYDTDRQADSRHNGNCGSRHTEERENTARENGGKENQGNADQNATVKTGTSEVQIHRHDSDYRSAMENPVDPKAKPSPRPTEGKDSEWL